MLNRLSAIVCPVTSCEEDRVGLYMDVTFKSNRAKDLPALRGAPGRTAREWRAREWMVSALSIFERRYCKGDYFEIFTVIHVPTLRVTIQPGNLPT